MHSLSLTFKFWLIQDYQKINCFKDELTTTQKCKQKFFTTIIRNKILIKIVMKDKGENKIGKRI